MKWFIPKEWLGHILYNLTYEEAEIIDPKIGSIISKKEYDKFRYCKLKIKIPPCGIKIIEPVCVLTEKEYEDFKVYLCYGGQAKYWTNTVQRRIREV